MCVVRNGAACVGHHVLNWIGTRVRRAGGVLSALGAHRREHGVNAALLETWLSDQIGLLFYAFFFTDFHTIVK